MYSPHRNEFQFYDVFMRDNGITGIGSMMNHSLESNVFFIKNHIELYKEDADSIGGDLLKIVTLKDRLMQRLGFGELEKRHKSYGWELLGHYKQWFDPTIYNKEFINKYNFTTNSIKWNNILGDLIGKGPEENYNNYGYEFGNGKW